MSKSLNIPWIFAIGWMVVIFYLSHQPGEDSGELSSLVATVFSLIPLPEEELHYLVRKGAHVFAYFLLAILVYAASRKWHAAFLLSVSYAMTDEFHQTFIPGRSGQWSDVGIDTIGAGVGVLIFALGEKVWKEYLSKKRRK